MAGDNENPMNISASRGYLREMAIKKWKIEDTDELAEKLVEMLIEKYPVITLGNANLLHYSEEDRERAAELPEEQRKKNRGPGDIVPKLYAVVDVYDESIFGGFEEPKLMSKEQALEFAKEEYPSANETFLEHVTLEWNSTHLTMRKSQPPTIYPLDGTVEIPESDKEKIRDTLLKKTKAILKEDDPVKSGDIARSVYSTFADLNSEVNRIRKTRIDAKRKWIDDHYVVRAGEEITKKRPSDAPFHPATVDLQTTVDYELVSALLRMFAKAAIATVLCKSQLWMGEESGELSERASLTEDDRIGVGEGEELRPIIENMLKLNFSVQPIFNKYGLTLGTLELKTLTTYITQNGWNSLPAKINVEELREKKILGRKLPVISPETDVETVAVYLSTEMNTDGVLFEWKEEADSGILPDDCKGILKDGFHIVTSHDLIAYEMLGGSN